MALPGNRQPASITEVIRLAVDDVLIVDLGAFRQRLYNLVHHTVQVMYYSAPLTAVLSVLIGMSGDHEGKKVCDSRHQFCYVAWRHLVEHALQSARDLLYVLDVKLGHSSPSSGTIEVLNRHTGRCAD